MFLIITMGCSEKKVKCSFNVIDYSSFNGWTGIYSIKVDSIGRTYIQGEDSKKGNWFIRTEIAPDVLDSLYTLVNNIDFTKLDTLYKKKCEDCGYYYLIINQRNISKIQRYRISATWFGTTGPQVQILSPQP